MSVSISLLAGAGWQFFDNNGIPLAGGLLYTYAAGTTTPLATYTTSAGSIANSNPIVLDSAGRTPNEIWLTDGSAYKFVLKTSTSTQIGSYDNITGGNDFTSIYAALAASSGSSLIGYIQGGAGSVAETVQTKLREVVSVKDFGADSTGTTSAVSAFNSALLIGGTIYVPSGTYKLDSKVSLTVNNTTLWLAANVTLNLSGVSAVQSPFGNQIHVIANNCAIIGSGPSSLLQITSGSQANAIGILHKAGFTVRDLTIDGGKAGGSAISDDTFMSGVSIVCTTAGGATTDVQATIDNCVIQNFLQYGVNIFGDQANGVKIVNCNIRNNGKTGDANSVGAGIVATKSVSDLTIANNVLKNNKQNGILCSSAGANGSYYVISGNSCHQNGGSGIGFVEQSNYGSIVGQGLTGITVTGNTCSGNTIHGIVFGTADNVGLLSYISVSGNVCNGNTQYGILAICSAAPNNVSNITLGSNNAVGNTTAQIAVSTNATGVEGAQASFTPVVQGTSSAGTATYASQVGFYTKIGNVVYFQVFLDWSAHTGTGDIRIAGFPYAAENSEPTSVNWVWANGLTITGQATFGVTENQTYGALSSVNNGAVGTVAMDASATLRINGFYFTAL